MRQLVAICTVSSRGSECLLQEEARVSMSTFIGTTCISSRTKTSRQGTTPNTRRKVPPSLSNPQAALLSHNSTKRHCSGSTQVKSYPLNVGTSTCVSGTPTPTLSSTTQPTTLK